MGDKFDVEAALKDHPENEVAQYLAEQHGIDRDAFLKDGHTDAEFIKEFGGMPLPVVKEKTTESEEPAQNETSNAVNAVAGTAAVAFPQVASYGANKARDLVRKTLGVPGKETAPKSSNLMPPQSTFATPSQVEARIIKAGQPPRPSGPGDVVNWAMGKTPTSGQYGRGYLGGTSQEHEAQLHKQADELERKNPGYKIKPGTSNFLIPESEYNNIITNDAQVQKDLEAKAKMNAELRAQRLAQIQVNPTLGQRVSQGALNLGTSGPAKQFMTGYNASDLLQAQNPFEATVSTAGAVAPYGSQLLEKFVPKKYKSFVKVAGPIIGAAAPAINYLERKIVGPKQESVEGHAKGGSILNQFEKLFEPVAKSGSQLARETTYVHDIKPTHTFSEVKPISIQDLQGGVLVPVPGDRSLAGHSILSINGVPLSKETQLYGGPRYGQQKTDLGEDAFWASQKGAASGLQNKAIRAAELAKGNPVYGEYVAMDPFSSAYALHHTDALMNQLDALNPSKKNIKGFNNIIKEIYPEFLGMTHPEVMDQLSKNPELRKYLADRLNVSKNVNQFGMPSGEATIHAITEPALRNVKTGNTGFSVGELNPSGQLSPELTHPTYDTQIPGKFKGQMIAQLPWQVYFPDAAAKIAENPKQAPYAFGTFKMGDYNQPVTQELVDKIAPIEEMVQSAKKDFGHAEGGSIQHFQSGGLSKIANVLSAAERLANKAKFLSEKHPSVPDVMYHGTTKDFSSFDPTIQSNNVDPNHIINRGMTFLSPSPNLSNMYAGLEKGANVMPVHTNVSNPFDFKNPQHVENLASKIAKNSGYYPSVIPEKTSEIYSNLLDANGQWSHYEQPHIINAIKDLGHDSMYLNEDGVKTLGVFNPNKIKSAIGNEGTYNPLNPDITKAEGGLIHLAKGGSTEAWTRKEGKNPEGGLNAKGRASYNKAHGAHLKAPQPEGGSRKDSFCARMEGAKKKLTSAETANDPDSRINKALRKWKC
jgi:hypothetical protein